MVREPNAKTPPSTWTERLEARRLLCGVIPDEALAHPVSMQTQTALMADATTPQTLRVEVGNAANHTDTYGKVWSADAGVSGGTVAADTYDVANTRDDKLYYTRRWGTAFDYRISVASGDYTLRLLFADPAFTQAGKRKFNVDAEGRRLLSSFDLAANGGGKAAITRSFDLSITDGRLDLAFRGVVGNAMLSAFELKPRTPAATSTWRRVAPIPVPRFEAQSAAVNGKLYVIGGFYNAQTQATGRVDAYDPANNTWAQRADMPVTLTHAGVAVDGQSVWLVGGLVGHYPGAVTSDVWVYNAGNNTWSRGPKLPGARAAGGLVKLGRNLHYFGGFREDYQTDSPDHFVLNLDDAARGPTTWRSAAPLPNPRNHLGAAAAGGKVYAIGGQLGRDETNKNQTAVHAFDPATNRWTAVAGLPKPRSHHHTSTFVIGGKVLIAGGVTNGRVPLRDLTEYDPSANRWSELTPFPESRKAPSAVAIGNLIVVAAGSAGDSDPRKDTWVRTR